MKLLKKPFGRIQIFAALVATFVVLGTQVDLLDQLMWHDQQRIGQLGFLLGLGILSTLTLGNLPGKATTPPKAVVLALILFAIAGGISSTNSMLPHWAWIEWCLLMALITGSILVAWLHAANPDEFDRTFLFVFCGVCAIFTLRVVATYAAGLAAGGPLDTRELSALGFSNRRFFGQLQALTLPLFPAILCIFSHKQARFAAWLLFCLWWMLAFVSATRGTFFGLAAAAMFIACSCGSSGHTWLKKQMVAIATGGILFIATFLALPQVLSVSVNVEDRLSGLASDSGRLEIWKHSLEIIWAHPWLGIGPMHLAYQRDIAVPVAHPHNAWLQLSAEWGIPACVLLAICAAYAIARYSRPSEITGASSPLRTGLLGALVASCAQGVVDGVIVMPVTQTILMIIIGWAIGDYSASLRTPPQISSPRYGRPVLVAGFVALVAALNLLAAPDVQRIKERQDRYIQKHGLYLHPRFWQQGWIDPELDLRPGPRM